jgi:hypothetical protein
VGEKSTYGENGKAKAGFSLNWPVSTDWLQREVFILEGVLEPSLWFTFGKGTRVEIKSKCIFLILFHIALSNLRVFMFGI